MGEDSVEQRRSPIGLVGLAARLREIPNPPSDADALVAVIDRRCWQDLEFGLIDLDPRLSQIRRETLNHLNKIKKEVDKLFKLNHTNDSVNVFNIALPSLVKEKDPWKAHQHCAALYNAIETIENFPLVSDRRPHAKRPSASARINELLCALGEYLDEVENAPFTVNIYKGEDGRMIFKSRAAYLARALVDSLGLGVPDTELKTILNKVRAELATVK